MLIYYRRNAKAKKNYIIFQHRIVVLFYHDLNQLMFTFLRPLLEAQKMQLFNLISFQKHIVCQKRTGQGVCGTLNRRPYCSGFHRLCVEQTRPFKISSRRKRLGPYRLTLDQDGIQQMINKAMLERKEKLENSRNLQIQMRPEFVSALEKCLNFSHEKGKSVNLLKENSKRKRTREEIENVKEEEEQLRGDKQQYLIQNKRLRLEKQEMEQELQLLRGIAEELANAPQALNENMQNQQFII